MQTFIFLAVTALVMLANALIALVLAWVFTELIPLPLNRKPFNCRGCTSFWFTMLMGLGWAVLLTKYIAPDLGNAGDYILFFGISAVATLMGVINYMYIKFKFKIYE